MIQKLPHEHINSKMADVISKKMPDRENFQIAADIFKLLDDPNRLQIFWVLCHVEACVINLAAILNTSSPNLSHHLKILKDSGLIVSRREGKEVYYKAANTNEANMLHKALEQIMRKYNLSPEELLVVDDLKPAWVMCHNAGVPIGFAAWSKVGCTDILEEMARLCDYTFHSPAQLEEFLFA